MSVTSAVCNSYKKERQQGLHDLLTHTIKVALIKDSPTGNYGASTTNYSDLTGSSDETSGAGYSAGGATLASKTLTDDGGTIVFDFADLAWGPGASFSARGFLLYNASAGDRAICVIDFGETKTVANGTFTYMLPLPTSSLGLMRSA